MRTRSDITGLLARTGFDAVDAAHADARDGAAPDSHSTAGESLDARIPTNPAHARALAKSRLAGLAARPEGRQ